MEKQMTIQSTWMLLENVKNVANRPVEWLRQYYSSVLERNINMRQTWNLIEVQAAFFAGIMPATRGLLRLVPHGPEALPPDAISAEKLLIHGYLLQKYPF